MAEVYLRRLTSTVKTIPLTPAILIKMSHENLIELKKILSVQNIACETLGTFEKLLTDDGFEIAKLKAQEIRLTRSTEYSAIIILGGPASVYDNLPYLQKEQELIRDAIRNEVPVLGVCLGSQLIAQATGGRVFRGPKKEVGWFKVLLSEKGRKDLFAGLETPLTVFQWHGDTYELPKEATVLAYSDLYPQAFKVGTAYGIQFHLEVDRSMIELWSKEYCSEVREQGLDRNKIICRNDEAEKLAKSCQMVYRNFVRIIR